MVLVKLLQMRNYYPTPI